jgi:hypothetical protein
MPEVIPSRCASWVNEPTGAAVPASNRQGSPVSRTALNSSLSSCRVPTGKDSSRGFHTASTALEPATSKWISHAASELTTRPSSLLTAKKISRASISSANPASLRTADGISARSPSVGQVSDSIGAPAY